MTYEQFLGRLREMPRTWWELVDPYEAGVSGDALIRLKQDTTVCPLESVIDWESYPAKDAPEWWSAVRSAADGHSRDGRLVSPAYRDAVAAVRRDLLDACGLEEDG